MLGFHLSAITIGMQFVMIYESNRMGIDRMEKDIKKSKTNLHSIRNSDSLRKSSNIEGKFITILFLNPKPFNFSSSIVLSLSDIIVSLKDSSKTKSIQKTAVHQRY
jgi:hypothetical protein